MIDERIAIDLPTPWDGGRFETGCIGPINYLVGPNASGKSRFAAELLRHLNSRGTCARLLGTDRLREMADPGTLGNYLGDSLRAGYSKSLFDWLRREGARGSGIDTILLLEERVDLRIRIEATLSHLFDRDVLLEWDSGNLVPKAVRGDGGQAYRLDRDECHGIKELLVLLTHLYDFGHRYLIIDEPELNLHPQYQAFFMQKVREVAGDPVDSPNKKIIFLITHSPFILDLRVEDDIKSIISFGLDYSCPRQIANSSTDLSLAVVGPGRLNAHRKQLFFSDNPIFVEGHHDALLVEALSESRGVSVAAAGSCIIDCGGMEEANHYLKLCQCLGKEAHFIYDLDSLFRGRLRGCIGDDDAVRSLLASAGVGPNFVKYVGELDRALTALIDLLLETTLDGHLQPLHHVFTNLGADRTKWEKDHLRKARMATMVMVSRNRDAIVSIVPENTVEDIEGRLQVILGILADRNIHVLPGGTIERYLPCFAGDPLDPKPEAKRSAVISEVQEMQRICDSNDLGRDEALLDRYGDLYEVVGRLPSKAPVDFERVLRVHLSDFVHELQKVVKGKPNWGLERIERYMGRHPLGRSGVARLQTLRSGPNGQFEATIGISDLFGDGPRILDVCADTTIQNMPAFRQEETG